jgi:hypothetical protein
MAPRVAVLRLLALITLDRVTLPGLGVGGVAELDENGLAQTLGVSSFRRWASSSAAFTPTHRADAHRRNQRSAFRQIDGLAFGLAHPRRGVGRIRSGGAKGAARARRWRRRTRLTAACRILRRCR